MTKGRILIVEDEVIIAQDLRDILEMLSYEVSAVAYSYDQAIAALAAKEFDLAFLDIALRGVGSGLDVADVIIDKYKIPFIFLTSFSDQDSINQVVSKNPGGYLVKPFKEKDISPALELALANNKLRNKEIFPKLEVINDKITKPLSKQEYKVLRLLWQGRKNAEVAEELFVSINTIKSHILSLYGKLEVHSRVSAINKVMNL